MSAAMTYSTQVHLTQGGVPITPLKTIKTTFVIAAVKNRAHMYMMYTNCQPVYDSAMTAPAV